MKLMLLIPNFALMAIAGYNLSVEFSGTESSGYLLSKLLHIAVLLITVFFTVVIVKSMFYVKYVEIPAEEITEDAEYNEYELRHS